MSEPIRILHVIGLMDRGGAETMIMNLYRNIDRRKVQFDFVENRAIEGAYDPEIQSLGGRIYRCPHYNGKNHFSYTKWWHSFMKEHSNEFVVVHGHLGSTAAIYLSIAKKYGLYTIAHSHSVSSFSLYSFIYSIFSYPTRYIADHFFGCSDIAGLDRYGKRISSNSYKYTTLKCSIETDRFSYNAHSRKTVRDEYKLNNQLVLGHIGRFVPAKNHSFILEIFRCIHHTTPNSVLLLVGDGELRPQIEAKVAELSLTDSVVFAGAHNDVSQFYQAMDVFVFPSQYEGFGMVALEAQTSGLPCVISDVIPRDCIVTDLVTQLPLSMSASEWASEIATKLDQPRTDHSSEVAASGFDISDTAKWLESFYLKIGD